MAGPGVRGGIAQTGPLRSLGQEALVALFRTADVLRGRLAALVEPHGVTLQQYNVLRVLRGAGADGLPTLDIAVRMLEEAPGITGLIDRLEAKGLVERSRGRRDRRQIICRVTDLGRALLAGLDTEADRWDTGALAVVSDADLRHLVNTLQAIRDAHRAPGETPHRR